MIVYEDTVAHDFMGTTAGERAFELHLKNMEFIMKAKRYASFTWRPEYQYVKEQQQYRLRLYADRKLRRPLTVSTIAEDSPSEEGPAVGTAASHAEKPRE